MNDYTRQIHINADPQTVFGTLTTAAEFASWWAPATGSAAEDGTVRITFDGFDDPLVLQVRQATPSRISWEVTSGGPLPEWTGTTPAFTLSRSGTGGCDLEFRHGGVTPQLECYENCREGWEQYVPSLRDYLETGTGNPYTHARLG